MFSTIFFPSIIVEGSWIRDQYTQCYIEYDRVLIILIPNNQDMNDLNDVNGAQQQNSFNLLD